MIRIDRAGRDHSELLDPENWTSYNWNGNPLRDCRGCEDCQTEDYLRGEAHFQCYGEGQLEDVRYGVSVCADLDDLIEYLAQVGGTDLDNAVLVELRGDYSDDDGHDDRLGEELILPAEIVSIAPLADDTASRILNRIDELA